MVALNLVRSELTRSSLTFNNVTKDVSFYTTTSRFVAWLGAFSQERQNLWLPKDDLQDSASWSSSPLLLLPGLRLRLCSSGTSTPNLLPTVIVWTRHMARELGARALVGRSSQDGDAQQQEAGPLLIPQLTKLHEAYHWRGEDVPTCPTSLLNIG